MKLPKYVLVGKERIRVIRHTLPPHQDKTLKQVGLAIWPDSPEERRERTITVSWGLNDDLVLATYLHEIFHQCLPDLDEGAIKKLEGATMTALVRLKPDRQNHEWSTEKARWVAHREPR